MRVAVTVALSKRIGQVLTPALAGDIAREICAMRDDSVDPARVPAEVDDGITFQIERLRDAFEALQAQRRAYLDEREPGRPQLIDWDRLLELSRLGRLVIFTARDAAGALFGSMWVWIGPSIDTGYVTLTDDILYVEPARRGHWTTIKLWQYGERAAFALGVREAIIHMRHGNRMERLARFTGYKPDSLRVTKRHHAETFDGAPDAPRERQLIPENVLSHERLLEVMHYDPLTGIFTWRVRLGRNNPGCVAGARKNDAGYLRITIDYRTYRAHRLAWFYVHGLWPQFEIDHKNGRRADNRIDNLRDATPLVNAQNKQGAQSNSKTGVLGVSWSTREEKFVARIKIGAKYRSLGQHDTIEAASAAYLAAKREHHAGCTI